MKTFQQFIEESWSAKYKESIDCNNPKGFSQRAHCQGRKKKKILEHCGCIDNAVDELESGLEKLNDTSYDSIDKLMRKIMKKHDLTAKELHNAFVDTHGKIPDEWIKEKNKVEEEFKQMPGQLMNKQMMKLQKSQSDLRKGRQTKKKRDRETKYDMQMKSIQLAGKQDYNEKGESYGKFWEDPLKTGKIRNHRFR